MSVDGTHIKSRSPYDQSRNIRSIVRLVLPGISTLYSACLPCVMATCLQSPLTVLLSAIDKLADCLVEQVDPLAKNLKQIDDSIEICLYAIRISHHLA